MTSSSLTFLRTVPTEQATIFNTFIGKATKARQDITITGDVRLKQLASYVQTARSALSDLQQRANDAATSIEKAATVLPASDALSELGTLKIKLALESGKNLHELCRLFVKEQDMPGLLTLKALIPYKEDARNVKESLDTVTTYEAQLYTPAQQAAALERREMEASMGSVRANFTTLANFLDIQATPAAVSGLMVKPDRLMAWPGLPGDGQYTGPILLNDGLESYHARPNVAATADVEAGKRFDPASMSYRVTR